MRIAVRSAQEFIITGTSGGSASGTDPPRRTQTNSIRARPVIAICVVHTSKVFGAITERPPQITLASGR